MSKRRTERKFPQLSLTGLKYCSVFYEGQHDDARTNIALAQTAAKFGADILNYCEVIKLIKESTESERIIGVTVKDQLSGEIFDIKSKSIVFCGGPFTDELRRLENPDCKDVVTGAGGKQQCRCKNIIDLFESRYSYCYSWTLFPKIIWFG